MLKRTVSNEVLYQDEEETRVKISSPVNGTDIFVIDTEEWNRLHDDYENIFFTTQKIDRTKYKRYGIKPYVYVTHGPYGHSPSQRTCSRLHRLICNTPEGMVTDHINGDSLDNRKSNLRVCTNAENARNNTLSATSSVGFKGVQGKSDGSRLPYRARIKYNYKEILLGRFVTKEEAALAYDKKAKELFGEYASLNYPDGPPPEVIEYINQANAHYAKTTSPGTGASQFVGVRYDKKAKSNPWRSVLKHNHQRYYLGSFATEEDAARAYDAKALELRGPIGRFNFYKKENKPI